VSEEVRPSIPFRGDGFFVLSKILATPPKEKTKMSLANELLKELGGFAAPADEQLALALVKLIEEDAAASRMQESEVYELYQRADGLLRETRDAESLSCLRSCARVVMSRLAGPQVGQEGFNMYEAVHIFEARLIEQALEEAHGSVTKAARRLGLTHQTLGTILNTRHKGLANKRTPVRKRLRSIMKKPAAKPEH
jgi:DNA-binding NtrC family response regulator